MSEYVCKQCKGVAVQSTWSYCAGCGGMFVQCGKCRILRAKVQKSIKKFERAEDYDEDIGWTVNCSDFSEAMDALKEVLGED